MNAMKTSLLATALCLGMGAAPVFAEDAAPPERTAAQAIDDATITASIKTKLLADERTKGFDINVDTMKGVVTLRGGADSQAAKQAAQEVAGQAEGVVLIKNELVVAPDDSDVANPDAWRNTVLCHEEGRLALSSVKAWGLVDLVRMKHPDGGIYSWWDYRLLGFPKNDGLRIDHIFATEPVARRLAAAAIDRNERKGKQPSDHAPVLVELTD